MSKLLALDQSSITTGYAIFENDKPIVISHFSSGSSSTDLSKRLLKFRNKILSLIEEYEIDEIAFEDIQLQTSAGNNVRTFKILAEVFGIVHEICAEMGIPYHVVPPITWKASFKFAGKGRAAEKKLARQFIQETYNLSCTEDEADAACLGLHVVKQKNSSFDWTE